MICIDYLIHDQSKRMEHKLLEFRQLMRDYL